MRVPSLDPMIMGCGSLPMNPTLLSKDHHDTPKVSCYSLSVNSIRQWVAMVTRINLLAFGGCQTRVWCISWGLGEELRWRTESHVVIFKQRIIQTGVNQECESHLCTRVRRVKNVSDNLTWAKKKKIISEHEDLQCERSLTGWLVSICCLVRGVRSGPVLQCCLCLACTLWTPTGQPFKLRCDIIWYVLQSRFVS